MDAGPLDAGFVRVRPTGRFFTHADRPIRSALANHAITVVERGRGGRSLGFKITLAANKNLVSIIDRIHDYCFAIKFKPDRELNLKRTAAGKQTTYYVCCAPRRPNTFPFSPPAESTWLGWSY